MAKPRTWLVVLAAVTAAFTAGSVAAAAPPVGAVPPVGAAPPVDQRVTVGSPATPFSQNKQNEPAVAIDPAQPNVVAAGANEEIDMESCSAGDPTHCPFSSGVGDSGVYFSFTGGSSWTQPTYSGWTARDCLGPAVCNPHVGPIGTLPGYYEAGLVTNGDPALAFGPRPDAHGHFAWSNGSRLYYSTLVLDLPGASPFRGAGAIAVSRTDDVAAAAAGHDAAWRRPVIVSSKQSPTTFADKDQVGTDNSASSPFFGNVYICWDSIRGSGDMAPTPLMVARSSDGGNSWTAQQIGPATNNANNTQADGCTIRTDRRGNAYLFGIGTRHGQSVQLMYRSTDGGKHWAGPTLVAPVVRPGVLDPVEGRPVIDGIAGERVDLAAAPSVDIANGRPTGSGATDEIFMSWADGRAGLNHEQLMLTWSTDRGRTWATPRAVPLATADRPFYTATAVSPNGRDLYLVYNALSTPYRANTTDPRTLVGVVLHADLAGGTPGPFTELDRSATGDSRAASLNDLTSEFLGDYVYAAATDSGVVGVWNDTSNAADCPAVDAYRASLYTGSPLSPPDVPAACPATFGNSDIRGASLADPTR
jgi:hypothetical protein